MRSRSTNIRKPAVSVTPVVSQVFWRATCNTEVYCGPLGVPIASVEEDTIIKEDFRYYDVFDNLWIATSGEDGGTVWLRPFSPSDELDDESDGDTPDWEIVKCVDPSKMTAETMITIEQPIPLKPLNTPCFPVPPDGSGFFSKLLSSIGHYWDVMHENDSKTEGFRDWNTEYQLLLEDILYNIGSRVKKSDIEDARKKIHCLVQDFADAVETTVVMIAQEMFEPNEKKTVKTLPTAVGTYLYNGILFMLSIDCDGSLGGDSQAMKIASETSRTIGYISHTAPKNFLYTPITITMTYAGFRVQAISIPPIGGKGDQICIAPGMSAFVDSLVEETAKELRLSRNGEPFLSDTKVYRGYDCRLYIFPGSRLLPPQVPPQVHRTYNVKVNSASWRLRPEAMDLLNRPLNSDALTIGQNSPDEVKDLQAATNCIKDELIPSISSILGFMEPCPAELELSHIICKGCGKNITNEVRFAVCDNIEHCCVICPQCYINAMGVLINGEPKKENTNEVVPDMSEEAATNTDVTRADGDMRDESEEEITTEETNAKKYSAQCAKRLKSYIDCGSSCPGVRGLHMIPDVTSLFHCKGLNLRFLQAVYHSIPLSAKCFTGQYLEIEMVARAAKHILWKKLRSATDPDEIVDVCGKFFTALMEPDGDIAEKFWASELGPYIRNLFDVFVPFDTEVLPILLVYERISSLTGVELTDASINSFMRQSTGSVPKKDVRPFVRIKRIHPVMKMIRIPAFCEVIGGRFEHLRQKLAGLLLLWAGAHDTSKELFALHESKQPLFLTERELLL